MKLGRLCICGLPCRGWRITGACEWACLSLRELPSPFHPLTGILPELPLTKDQPGTGVTAPAHTPNHPWLESACLLIPPNFEEELATIPCEKVRTKDVKSVQRAQGLEFCQSQAQPKFIHPAASHLLQEPHPQALNVGLGWDPRV